MSDIINNIGRSVSKFLNFSPDILTNDLNITVYGGHQAIVDGYSKILEYDDNMVRISNGKNKLSIMGTNLVICELSEDALIIEGNICSTEFENFRG